MALAVGNCCGGVSRIRTPYAGSSIIPYHHSFCFFTLSFSPRNLQVVSAKKFSPRTGKNRRGSSTTTTQDQEDQRPDDVVLDADDGYFLPELPGDKPDFWEGSQWDALGFFVQYLWAFGIVFALIACGIAVATYNEGATDFKDTPAYKESIQSREFLEEPDDASNSDVFESNPTEVAPSLD